MHQEVEDLVDAIAAERFRLITDGLSKEEVIDELTKAMASALITLKSVVCEHLTQEIEENETLTRDQVVSKYCRAVTLLSSDLECSVNTSKAIPYPPSDAKPIDEAVRDLAKYRLKNV